MARAGRKLATFVQVPRIANVNVNSIGAVNPCDDFTPCCNVHPINAHRTTCPRNRRTCPAGTAHRNSTRTHPRHFCNDCRDHNYQHSLNEIGSRIDQSPAHLWNLPHRFLSLLCRSCKIEEAKLYWERVSANAAGTFVAGNNPLVNPNTGPQIEAWPNPHNNWSQDLCVCRTRVVESHRDECHECRANHLLDRKREMRRTYDFLRFNSKNTVNGTNQQNGTSTRRLGQALVGARQLRGIFARCPCGNDPESQAANTPLHMAVCLSCRGVVVDSAHLPPYLQQATLQRRRRGATKPTSGRHKIPKSAMFRVNQEIGALEVDRLPGGTY